MELIERRLNYFLSIATPMQSDWIIPFKVRAIGFSPSIPCVGAGVSGQLDVLSICLINAGV